MNNATKTCLLGFFAVCFGSVAIIGVANNSATAADPAVSLKKIRTVENNDLLDENFFQSGDPELSGVVFPPGANTQVLLNQPSGEATVELLTPPKNVRGAVVHTPVNIPNAINVAFNSVAYGAEGFGLYRLFMLDADLGELVAVKSEARNFMDPHSIKRFDARGFGVGNAKGMTLNPATGQLYLLDIAGPNLVRIQPKPGYNFADAEVDSIMLPGGLGQLQGVAYNPEDDHLYVLSTDRQILYKLTTEGVLVDSIDVSQQSIGAAQGMVFAPSLDSTDPPTNFHLYLVTLGEQNYQTTEWALPQPF